MSELDMPARIKRLRLPPGRRIIAVSDIHGNLPYLKGLLKKIRFDADDILIIDGDFLEKGPDSLGTLRYIMQLSEAGNVYTVCGNCDGWDDIFRMPPEADEHLLHYMMHKKCGLLWEMCNAAGIDPFELEGLSECKKQLFNSFTEEWKFISRLPHAIETKNYVFAHAAMRDGKPLSAHTAGELMRCDAFMNTGRSFEKWVIVGHWPVVLYGTDRVCANPIVDREHHIVSIDGGCVLKDDGQLNALIIPWDGSDSFGYVYYDPFPVRRVLRDQAEGGRSYYIRWGDSRVQVLERGEEFSRCRHVRTGYEMDILTKYLFSDGEFTDCNDCTDYVPSLKRGDPVSVVETTSRGYLIKTNGLSGWYFGELE